MEDALTYSEKLFVVIPSSARDLLFAKKPGKSRFLVVPKLRDSSE